MKINAFWLAAALVVGLVLGTWGPTSDLRKAREDMDALQAKQGQAARRSSELQGVKTMLRLPEETAKSGASSRHSKGHGGDAAGTTNAVGGTNAAPAVASDTSTNPPHKHESMEEQISKASELWRTRSAVARNNFISNAGLSGEQVTNFDVLVEAMNVRLEDRITQWADYLKAQKQMSPEDSIRMMNDLSDVLVMTYDEFDRTLPPTWREASSNSVQLVDFIDPEVALPLTDVEDLMQNPGGSSGHGTTTGQVAHPRPVPVRRTR